MKPYVALFILLILGLTGYVSSAATSTQGRENKQIGTYTKECLSGPTFWCSSVKNARTCRAVNHCIQTVWSKTVLPEDNDDICHMCKGMIQKVRDTLLSNNTKREMQMVLETSCKLIPARMIREECMKIADQFIPEILEMLAARMNPQSVCATVGLCNNRWIDQILAEYEAARHEDPVPKSVLYQCQYCQSTINKVQDGSRDVALEKTLELCGRLGPFTETCIALVIEYFDDYYDVFKDRLKETDVCKQFRFCNVSDREKAEKDGGKQLASFVPEDDVQCDFCESVVKHVRDILVVNTTDTEFKFLMESVCKQSGSFEEQCLDLVNQYYKMVYDFLVNGLDSREVCRLLALCPNPGVDSNQSWITTFSISSSEEDSGEIESDDGLGSNEDVDASDGTGSRLLYQLLNGDEGNSQSHDVVGVVPLDKDHDIGDVIDDDVTLGDLLHVLDLVEEPVAGSEKLSNTSYCLICEYAMNELDKRLSNTSTEEEIRRALDNLCAYLPSTVAEMCISFIDKYGDDVYHMLLQKLVPKAICIQIGLCMSAGSSDLISIPFEPQEEKAGIDTCQICKLVVSYIDQELEDDAVEDSLERMAQRACDFVPRRSKATCMAVVSNYGPYLISQLGIIGDQDKVCQMVHLCQPEKRQVVGSEKCTWGPSHWCSSIENAKSCNALEHCQTRVWFKAAP